MIEVYAVAISTIMVLIPMAKIYFDIGELKVEQKYIKQRLDHHIHHTVNGKSKH